MADRPKRLLVGLEDGEMELSEEDTARIYRCADHEGVTPEVFLKSLIHSRHLLMRHGLIKKEDLDG